jgi:3-methylcrotonyl-CoA carboxylase alpha subunit
MLKTILIANRGEIALRIIRTARRLGVRTVAAASAADLEAPFARQADAVVEIGPGPAAESYLRGDKIIAAALRTGAQAIHPGYGFLAESADFAEAVGKAGIKFIGPSPAAMRRMGSKGEAKAIAAKAAVPIIAGYQGESQAVKVLAKEAKRIGFPLLIKAVAGGGGRGMRCVESERDFPTLLASAQREAHAAFGDGRVLLEKLIERPRHIEVQVFGDAHGNVVHLFERDCSLQRRHQKVVEEAPAPHMSRELRQRLTQAAVACAQAVGYESAGTVEFLVEGGELGANAPWYFIEMNTRLQVEHPVTEAITGIDLVEWQLRVASGEKLPLSQGEITMAGHAIEARLNAEDPCREFLPSTGSIVAFEPPAGVRVDAGVERGSLISPYYDCMIAKLIAHASERHAAIKQLQDALNSLLIAGPKTNADFLFRLLAHAAFRHGALDTSFIGRELANLAPETFDQRAVEAGVVRLLLGETRRSAPAGPSPWEARDAFQLGPARCEHRTVLVDGAPRAFQIDWLPGGPQARLSGAPSPPAGALPDVRVIGQMSPLYVLNARRQVELRWPSFDAGGADEADASIRAPITGRLAKMFVRQGDLVAKGDRIAVIEAMKMEHVLHAGCAGRVARLAALEGQQVAEGALIAALDEAGGDERAPCA